jgi:creatinine amidohydrolase
MRFQDINWMDVERYLDQDDRIILVSGASAQQGYLSLAADTLIPMRMALAAAEWDSVLIAPPLNFGVSKLFVSFPGTISLSQETYNTVMMEIIQTLLSQGFGGFLIMNGHDGNKIPPQLQDMRQDEHTRVRWYDWWRGEAAQAFEASENLRIDHANWSENFPFTRVTDKMPGESKPLVNLGYVDDGSSLRDVLGDGSFGGPYQVEDSITQKLFDRVVDEIVSLLEELRR